MVGKLIRCTQCNQVIPHFGTFGDFGNSSFLPGVEWSTEDLQCQEEFFHFHQRHRLEDLRVDPETFISDKPCYEPTKVSYFEATNGKERFVVRRAKRGLDSPAVYELIPNRI